MPRQQSKPAGPCSFTAPRANSKRRSHALSSPMQWVSSFQSCSAVKTTGISRQARSTAPAILFQRSALRNSSPLSPILPGLAISIATSNWCRTRSVDSRTKRSVPSPNTSIERTPTFQKISFRASPNLAASASPSRSNTTGTAKAARANTWAWWWPPRNSQRCHSGPAVH
ncbi:unannotated protein [freshwater metagenome]|uniref:Unannotated protein n=1 Tax=freshwater metagenome TaxID=449393 RepID=A0A6J6JP41_9ZZZZ